MVDEKIDDLKKTNVQLDSKVSRLTTGNREKDKSEKSTFRFLAPIISSLLISLAATYATITYNDRQLQLSQIDALDKYRNYLNSDDPLKRQFGYQVFVWLGFEEFVLNLVNSRTDPAGTRIVTLLAKSDTKFTKQVAETADKLMAKAPPIEQKTLPVPIASKDLINAKEGWVYLGHYESSEKAWRTRYFNFSSKTEPSNLKGEKLEVREETGSINIREGMPMFTGAFREVVDVLKVGSEVTVIDLDEWHSSGYIWAKVQYGL